MPITRKFLPWDSFALASAADFLLEGHVGNGVADLSELVVALPGGRAGRRLLEILIDRTDQQSLILQPPGIITSGRLPELLYLAKKTFAEDLTQRLTWVEALKATHPDQLAEVIREPPARDDLFAWLSLGEMLSRIHRELAADGLDFDDVVKRAGAIEGFNETARWQALAEIQRTYLTRLDVLELWDMQTARLFAIEHHECSTDKQIVLVGTVDLNRAQRQMLDQVADNVTAVIFAPEEVADRFDEHGCLLPDAWQDVPIDVARDLIDVVDTAADQADAVVRAIAAFDAEFSAEEISIGVPDERLVSPIQQRLDECGIASRYGVGMPATRMGPSLMLDAVADYLEGRSPAAFAALVRHPALAHWLASQSIQGDSLTQLDEYRAAHLPTRMDGKWLGAHSSDYDILQKVYEQVDGKQGLLHELSGAKRSVGDWSERILSLLVNVYQLIPLDREHAEGWNAISACDAVRDALLEQREIPTDLVPSVTAAEAIRLLQQAISGATIPQRADQTAVELLGWLELTLDDAPALIISGFNDGLVPASRNSDLFLPNELRRQLGLEDNNRIYARDAYALSMIAASRKSLKIIAGRRSADNDPLIPSRLLFACEPQEMAERTLEFIGGESKPRPRTMLSGSLMAGQQKSLFAIPRPLEPLPDVKSMRVTEFRDYIACPYRYYLKHQLSLGAVDDDVEELGGGEFGSLLHDVLKAFGESTARAFDDADKITASLNQLLNEEVQRLFGPYPLSAVNVQVEQIRYRLQVFAEWQANWTQQGWEIKATEANIKDETAEFDVDGMPMFLRGRIDRIDVNEQTGEIVVFDYKTGDAGSHPDKTHRSRDEWVDLQLPLYRHLLRYIEGLTDVDATAVRLGYIVIPKSLADIGHRLAEWTPEDLAHADDTARDIIRDIRAGRYEPATVLPAFFEEFAAICLDGQFGGQAENREDE